MSIPSEVMDSTNLLEDIAGLRSVKPRAFLVDEMRLVCVDLLVLSRRAGMRCAGQISGRKVYYVRLEPRLPAILRCARFATWLTRH